MPMPSTSTDPFKNINETQNTQIDESTEAEALYIDNYGSRNNNISNHSNTIDSFRPSRQSSRQQSLNQISLDRDFEDTLTNALNSNPFADYSERSSILEGEANTKTAKDSIPLHRLSFNGNSSNIKMTDHFYDDDEAESNGDIPLISSSSNSKYPHKSYKDSKSIWSRGVQSLLNTNRLVLRDNNSNIKSNSNRNRSGSNSNDGDDDSSQISEQRIITPHMDTRNMPSNAISNAKYNFISFIPIILYEQFKFFFNLYFLLVALSQIVPQLRIGYLSSYVVPLAFVLTVTMMKEAIDDIQRRRRDSEQNNELYEIIGSSSPKKVAAKDLKCGDLVVLHKDIRIPADMILLQSSESNGESFIKTDQLDGETDWKLRISPSITQSLPRDDLEMIKIDSSGPSKHIHSYLGRLTYGDNTIGLTIDNTLWANTVLASGSAVGCIIYTGKDTRQSMNTSTPGVKTGLLELEINSLSKILCVCVFVLSIVLVGCQGFTNDWYVDIMRFLILFSTIIPVSLRVNLDLGKSVYAYQIEHDPYIPDTIVRTSTIPEDLGRIEYLLSDKTGTLTQNDMELKKLHLGTVSYAGDTMDLVADYISDMSDSHIPDVNGSTKLSRRDLGTRVRDLVTTLAVCHNVTPTFEDDEITYQAASPDEVAIVKYTQSIGLSLVKRDRTSLSLLHTASERIINYDILHVFPFSSETKRMGIIVYDKTKGEYWFMQKGADTVMMKIVQQNDWLEEETGNMAREGLRTLVIARKKLSENLYNEFNKKYLDASASMINRDQTMARVINRYLEHDMELLGLTGVEDRLQKDVKSSIELLRNAGVKIWMLTGDKVETARCVSVSAKLITRGQYVHTITKLNRPELALQQIEYLKSNRDACLLIDGESLALYLSYFRHEFFDIVIHLPTVVASRCSPQQKADVALLIRELTKKRVCCIGDGGNDVSMIQCADVGVGIVGKEGKQASLAADFSITQFCHLTKLLLWHGRNSYKRSAKLSQFVIHRGLLISVCQAVYSISSSFEPIALYQGWLMVGYATCYTMAPVFSLVLDCDVSENLVSLYPELYKELTEGRSLSFKTFFVWCFVSLYQGVVIQGLSQVFTSLDTEMFTTMVALSFSALIFNELAMVAIEINKWRKAMLLSELVTLGFYIASIPFLTDYYNLDYVSSISFFWQTIVILSISLLPIWGAKVINRKLRPPNYAKVQQA